MNVLEARGLLAHARCRHMFADGRRQRKHVFRPLAKRTRSSMTYSIIAYDPQAGLIGGAVQSHYFSVGTQVLWAKPGVGVVVTQMMVEPSYGVRGLELLEQGGSPRSVLNVLLASDSAPDERQVAMLDAMGQ